MDLRRSAIAATDVLSSVGRIPRGVFTPDSVRHQAYENLAIPIEQGQTLSQPQVVALMTQALRASRRTKVLEVGTGPGYQAAVLLRICRRVYTIELFKRSQERRVGEEGARTSRDRVLQGH